MAEPGLNIVLPKKLTVILDTSAFSSPEGLTDWRVLSSPQFDNERSRLYALNEVLYPQANWFLTCGVKNEFEGGNVMLGRLIQEERLENKVKLKAMRGLLEERKRTYRMMMGRDRILCWSFDPRYLERAWDYYRYVMEIFLKNGGHQNNSQTDVFMASVAVAHATDHPTYVLSHDYSLVTAFALESVRVGARNAAVIDEKIGRTFKVDKWLRYHKLGRLIDDSKPI